ncbi:MAG: peptidoglycan bridge formation glycyltransferase FemA/FemB family protein [Patescibacteria group bacterium]|nr:peptidoglycan bridge formation glycyltransferase FemA/FemB family protein [Patescibacteria group bacterium]
MRQPRLDHIEQSQAWIKFQESIPYRGKSWKIGKSHIIRHSLPGKYCWFDCPRGKLSLKNIEQIEKIAKKENAVFLRLEPPANFKPHKKFRKAHAHHQPEQTLVIDLSKPEEKILAQMKEKGRYNIRLAEKKGVKVKKSKNVKTFYPLLEKTTTRDKFSSHPLSYYESMLKNMSGEDRAKGFAKLFVAEYEEEKIAALIATFYKNTATYYFGASSDRRRNIMAPYLLQWEAMRYAKKIGCKYYDFLGVAPDGAKNHPWAGVTQFKRKFGGISVKYPPAKEYVFKNPLYYLMRLVKRVRRIFG